MPSDTEGRYRPEASASASDPRLDRRGREVSPELLGRALRGSPGSIFRDRGGLGPSGCAPRLAWHGCFDSDSLLLVCVGVHFLCSPVHDMLGVSQFPPQIPFKYPPILYLYSKIGYLVICAMAQPKLSVWVHSVITCVQTLQQAEGKQAGNSGVASWVICWADGWGELDPPPPCLSLSFPLCSKHFLTS